MELNGKSNHADRNMDQIASNAHGTVDRLASGAHRAVDRFVGAAGSAADTFTQRREQITVAGSELADDVRDYVQSNPLVSIGIAAAIGFIFSRLVSSR
jgi:ElaB/YqjD/DUF883 family membrane-anchored ribosome-binding protein